MMNKKHRNQKIESLMYMLLVLWGTCYDLEIKVNVAHAILKTSKREQKFMPIFTLLKCAEKGPWVRAQ